MKCRICSKEAAEQNYCRQHAEAYRVVLKKYDRWKTARDISWKEYLSEIAKNSLTGKWAREVVRYLIDVEDEKNVKNG